MSNVRAVKKCRFFALLSHLLRKMAERGEEIRTWDRANTLVVSGVWLSLDIAVEKKSAVEHRFDRAPGTFAIFTY